MGKVRENARRPADLAQFLFAWCGCPRRADLAFVGGLAVALARVTRSASLD
jgi:hypothetical protein